MAGKITYLEVSPFDGNLITIGDSLEINLYLFGSLYILKSKYARLQNSYDVKIVHHREIYYDKLKRISRNSFRLAAGRGVSPELWPVFTAVKAIPFRGIMACQLIEETPELMDRLQEECDYHVVGETHVPISR